ncbi:MAG: hypothetical protein H0T76_06010 [Nannocystis sp.]|nr:hypothetical protein [Nannocystis sp.]MBA3546015.1 hypothetical protein [Nannocystis sp.]
MSRLTAALPFVAIISACTTNIYQTQQQEQSDTGASSSWTGWSPADSTGDESTSTSDASTTGGDAESTSAVESSGDDNTSDAADTTEGSEGSTSSGELIDTSTGDVDETTSGSTSTGEPIEEGTSSTGEPPPKLLGQICNGDDDCSSGWCSGSAMENEMRCTGECDPTIATSCQAQGHPGLCLQANPLKFACSGWGLPADTVFSTAAPLPYNTQTTLLDPEDRRVFLLPPSDNDRSFTMGAYWGMETSIPIFALYSSNGTFIADYTYTDKPTLPAGPHFWVVMRPTIANATGSFSVKNL